MKSFKKLMAWLLCAVMMLSMAACGKSGGNTTTAAPQGGSETKAPDSGTSAPEGTTAEQTEAPAETPAYVTEPITITFWHTSGSGKNYEYVEHAVQTFNETNEFGITVEEVYQEGSYGGLASNLTAAIAAKETPEVIFVSSGSTPTLYAADVLADLTPYVERDGVDMTNFPASMTGYCYRDGKILALPYNRSSALFFYNKDIYAEMNFEAPKSFEELLEQAKAITAAHPDVSGFSMHFDVMYFQEALVRSLGADGMIAKDGMSPGPLDNGELERLLTDWRNGIEEGYIAAPAVTKASSTNQQNLYDGKLAASLFSSGSLGNLLKYSKEAGMNLGVAFMPGYGGYASKSGGGNVAIVGRDKTDQQIAAAWEFVKFLESDEESALRASMTGYLPVTYSSTETDTIKKLWEEQPEYSIAFEQLDYSSESSWSLYQAEWETALEQAMSLVIQDRSMTPAEAIDFLKEQAKVIFTD